MPCGFVPSVLLQLMLSERPKNMSSFLESKMTSQVLMFLNGVKRLPQPMLSHSNESSVTRFGQNSVRSSLFQTQARCKSPIENRGGRIESSCRNTGSGFHTSAALVSQLFMRHQQCVFQWLELSFSASATQGLHREQKIWRDQYASLSGCLCSCAH